MASRPSGVGGDELEEFFQECFAEEWYDHESDGDKHGEEFQDEGACVSDSIPPSTEKSVSLIDQNRSQVQATDSTHGAYGWDSCFAFPPTWKEFILYCVDDKKKINPLARIEINAAGAKKLKACARINELLKNPKMRLRSRLALSRHKASDRKIFETQYYMAENLYNLLSRYGDDDLHGVIEDNGDVFATENNDIMKALNRLGNRLFKLPLTLEDRVKLLEEQMVDMMSKSGDSADSYGESSDSRSKKRCLGMGDLAAYRVIRPSARGGDRSWCSPGKVVSIYRDGAGPVVETIRESNRPDGYMVVTSMPTLLEEPQSGVPMEDQIKVVQLGECPVVLHDAEEYDKFRQLHCSAFVFVDRFGRVRITSSSKQRYIVAYAFEHQEYNSSGYPCFQNVDMSIRTTLAFIPQASRRSEGGGKTNDRKPKHKVEPFIIAGPKVIAKTFANVFGISL